MIPDHRQTRQAVIVVAESSSFFCKIDDNIRTTKTLVSLLLYTINITRTAFHAIKDPTVTSGYFIKLGLFIHFALEIYQLLVCINIIYMHW